jgi:L-serine dehydratase
MYQYQYGSQAEIYKIAKDKNLKISEIAILHEAERDEVVPQEVVGKMRTAFSVMKTNIKNGIESTEPSIGGLIGRNAAAMHNYCQNNRAYSGPMMGKAISYALAVTEENARMKRIVACPTAGASGVVPGCLIAAGEEMGYSDKELVDALFNASAMGIIIANNASISGAEGGCQAEVGAASAMAASALTELAGGDVEACFHAAAIALKNILGLVCDPVAGLVEVPCSKRNGMGVANAIAAADMACAGIKSMVPFDEVVHAMKEIGCSMTRELKETAKGGIAGSKTAREFAKNFKQKPGSGR